MLGQCTACGGSLMPLGVLGNRHHSRCRMCGLDHSSLVGDRGLDDDEDTADDDAPIGPRHRRAQIGQSMSRLMDKQKGRKS